MSSLKGLASIAKGLSATPTPELLEELSAQADPRKEVQVTLRKAAKPGRPLAKTRNQEYKRVMVLVKKNTEKKAYRKWEDAHPEKDFSDLVESLLSQYAAGHITA